MEFQAIILCGKGKSLSPFSKARSGGTSKALLPVANRPMIEYVLDWCEGAFFPRITVVSDSESAEGIKEVLEAYKARKSLSESGKNTVDEFSKNVEDRIEQMTIDGDATGEVLFQLYNSPTFKRKQHFVILPCDIITDLPPQVMIEAYRNREATDLGLLIYYRNQLDIEDKKSKIFPKNFTIYAELPNGSSQLLDLYSKEDIDFHRALKVRTQMCWRYPNATISSELLNSSIFFGCFDTLFGIFESDEDRFSGSYFQNRSLTKVLRDLSRRSWKHSKRLDTVGFCIVPNQATFLRANRIPVWIEANRHFLKIQAQKKAQLQSTVSQKDKTSAHVGVDSMLGDNTILGEKTNIKRSVLGANCQIGKRVKLNGCLILDGVTIEDDTKLENCIVGYNAKIGSKSVLTSCNVESSLEVAKGTNSKGETMLCLTLEGIVDKEESAIESESDYDSEESSEGYSDSELNEYGDNADGLFAY